MISPKEAREKTTNEINNMLNYIMNIISKEIDSCAKMGLNYTCFEHRSLCRLPRLRRLVVYSLKKEGYKARWSSWDEELIIKW